MLLSCEKMVEAFAGRLARECPELEFEDVKGDLWIVALDSLNRWVPGRDKGKFSTFLFQRLLWKRLDILHSVVNRGRLNRIIEEEVPQMEVPAVERSLDTLCEEVCSRLEEEEKKLFSLMIHSSPKLVEIISKHRTKRPKMYLYYSMCLGWRRGKVDYVVKKIQLAVEKVING